VSAQGLIAAACLVLFSVVVVVRIPLTEVSTLRPGARVVLLAALVGLSVRTVTILGIWVIVAVWIIH
jgi:hypothetical protein